MTHVNAICGRWTPIKYLLHFQSDYVSSWKRVEMYQNRVTAEKKLLRCIKNELQNYENFPVEYYVFREVFWVAALDPCFLSRNHFDLIFYLLKFRSKKKDILGTFACSLLLWYDSPYCTWHHIPYQYSKMKWKGHKDDVPIMVTLCLRSNKI